MIFFFKKSKVEAISSPAILILSCSSMSPCKRFKWFFFFVALKLHTDGELVAPLAPVEHRLAGMEGHHAGLSEDITRSVGVDDAVGADNVLRQREHVERCLEGGQCRVMEYDSLNIIDQLAGVVLCRIHYFVIVPFVCFLPT